MDKKEEEVQESQEQPQVVTSSSFPSLINPNYVFDPYNIPKINCFYHKGQTISNFCNQSNCLIPLCPLCVQLHTQEHAQEKTYPTLESLDQVLNSIYQQMTNQANHFANAYSELTNSIYQMWTFSQLTHEKLNEIKTRCIKVIEQYFHSVENEIYNRQKKNSENQTRDAELLKTMVKERWESHVSFLEQLNSAQSMKCVIPYYGSSILNDNQQYFQVIEQFINRFKDVQSQITFDQSKAADLSGHLNSLIKINHTAVSDFIGLHELAHPNLNRATKATSQPIKQVPKKIKQTVKQQIAQSSQLPSVLPQGLPQGYGSGIAFGLPQGIPQGLPQGFPQGLPQGFQSGFPQGFQQQVTPQGLPQGFSTGILSQGLPQGYGLSLNQGLAQSIPYQSQQFGQTHLNQQRV